MKAALLIMAAGIGSRYGAGIKQLATVDKSNHIIMDYSIHDAIEAGFTKIIFVLRREIEKDFYEIIGNRIEAICRSHGVEVCYVFQSLTDLPEGFALPEGRTNPWGTCQAILAAREELKEPFVVINADDYYGKEAYKTLLGFLKANRDETHFSMAGFVLKNTLSESGGVTRGICSVGEDGTLLSIQETRRIEKKQDPVTGEAMAVADGVTIPMESYVSMNMWGLTESFLPMLQEGFVTFLQTAAVENPLKAEFLLPIFIGELLEEGKVSVTVLPTKDAWFGVTYQEDKPLVEKSFAELLQKGVYKDDLFSDL